MLQTNTSHRLTAHDVRYIVGPIGDDRMSAILATKATPAQLVEAFTWLSSDEYLAGGLERPLTGVVAELYDILKAAEPDIEEERPRSA
jgi:hypothetical protein